MEMELHSSEESIDDIDFYAGVKLPMESPSLFSWVAVKSKKTVETSKGRKTVIPDMRIAKVYKYHRIIIIIVRTCKMTKIIVHFLKLFGLIDLFFIFRLRLLMRQEC